MLLWLFADVSDNPSGLRSSRPNVISPKVLSPEILSCSAQNFIMLKKIQQIQSERFIQNLGYGLISWRLFGLASRMKITRVVVHADCRPFHGWAGQCGTGRSSCSVGTCRSGLGFRWWKYPPELSSSVVFLWGSLSGSLQTVKQPCGVCGAGRLYQQPCQTTGGSLCATLRLFEVVSVVFLRCPSVTMASGEFATQDHLRQTVVLYSGYVTSPSELVLQ